MKFFSDSQKIILVFFFISVSSTIYYLGPQNISPYNTDWLFSQPDMATHYIGWCYFINDNWQFPIGLNPTYGFDNNSIIYSDSIPIFAFIFKFFKIFLTNNFSYFSFWVFICFFFQLFFSYKLVFFYTKNVLYSFICSLYFIIAPVFLQKMGYILAHGAQFLIISSLYLITFKHNNIKIFYWLILTVMSILINFYLLIITSVIFFIDKINHFLKIKNLKLFLK